MATLSYADARFTWAGSYEERHLPKTAGFRWDPERKKWWTSHTTTAAKLEDFADESALAVLRPHREAVAASKATDAEIDIPAPEGQAYLPYQKGGVAYTLAAYDAGRPGVLIADEMGLGKTIQAIGVINARPEIKRVCIVCPASLKLNWRNELKKWLIRDMPIEVWTGKTGSTAAAVTIINYDIVKKRLSDLKARGGFDLLILDESQAIKNEKAQRTKAVLDIPARFTVFLTGTPILNRPIELFTTMSRLDPAGLGRNFVGFGIRYAAAVQGKWGWDFSGASNLDELQEKLRSGLMVRRLKADVLKELPAKRRQVVALEPEGREAKTLIKAQKKAWDEIVAELGYEEAVRRLQSGGGFDFETLSASRKELAELKAPQVVDFVREALESSEKIVVFAHHHEMLDALAVGLTNHGFETARVDGRTPVDARQAQVDRFQNDKGCRVFIGGILAAGVGLTLTAASHVILAELPWRPADIQQAEDRCHRIGQVSSVLVQHLVYDGSLDADMAQLNVAKQDVADRALDTDHNATKNEEIARAAARVEEEREEARRAREKQRKALEDATRERLALMASIRPQEIKAVHKVLQFMADNDQDRAAVINGVGFNRMDGSFGHELAERRTLTPLQALAARKMLQKYRGQIPAVLFEAMWASQTETA